MKNFLMSRDANNRDTGAIPQSDTIYSLSMVTNTEKIVTVPAGATIAVFSATGNFYCRFGETVIIPAGDIIDGSAGELNPVARSVSGVTSIHMIAPSDIVVTILFYGVPTPPFI